MTLAFDILHSDGFSLLLHQRRPEGFQLSGSDAACSSGVAPRVVDGVYSSQPAAEYQ